jgi:predicted DNA-binding ArsR family transcriptional regulator
MSAYFVDKNKDINDIINNNTALRAVNEFNRKKEEDLKKKRALMKYLKDALNSTDYFIKA